jgi:hypothetical protein
MENIMLEVIVPAVTKKSVNWNGIFHPVLVQTPDGSILLTIEVKNNDERNSMYFYERDAICLHTKNSSSWVKGKTYSRLNLEDCELFDGKITITNQK